jgi:hypothetical protein
MADAITAKNVPATARNAASTGHQRPKVFVHIGEPKTGTTFLQQVMWRNRAALAAQGVVLPGHHPQDHFRASQDLRGIQKLPTDPAGSWTGEWEILASQAKQAPRAAVISHELFCAADAEHAERAVRSIQPAEVHIVLTARDIASLLPAEWQESVKHRTSRGWEDWLGDVIDHESWAADRRQWWFWRVHDTLAILDIWARHVPAERVHVITPSPHQAGGGLLWQRFAALLDIDPDSVDLSRARANSALGMPEIEFLHRLNKELPAEVPDWFYMVSVKEALAHQALADRPASGRLVLPEERTAWAKEHGQTVTTGLRAGGYDIVGDLEELLPQPASGPAVSPSDLPAGQVLEVAVQAAAALVVNQYRMEYPAAKPQPGMGGLSGLADRVESTVASSARLKRAVRELSSRHASVRQLRVLAWRALQWSGARKKPDNARE